jgi:hypothetical protein
VSAVAIALMLITACDTPLHISTNAYNYENPAWAPPYYSGARYYYLPDIEAYYDMSNRDFVYLDHGQWLFSPSLPSVYASFDLFDCFIIVLDFNVFQPWQHHQYYVSHYPRYYYHSFYRGMDLSTIRGFNENDRKPVYWRPEDRNRMNELRKTQMIPNKPINIRQPERPNYYGRNIGQPVKVRPQMKEIKPRHKKR